MLKCEQCRFKMGNMHCRDKRASVMRLPKVPCDGSRNFIPKLKVGDLVISMRDIPNLGVKGTTLRIKGMTPDRLHFFGSNEGWHASDHFVGANELDATKEQIQAYCKNKIPLYDYSTVDSMKLIYGTHGEVQEFHITSPAKAVKAEEFSRRFTEIIEEAREVGCIDGIRSSIIDLLGGIPNDDKDNDFVKYEFDGDCNINLVMNDAIRDDLRSFIVKGPKNSVAAILRDSAQNFTGKMQTPMQFPAVKYDKQSKMFKGYTKQQTPFKFYVIPTGAINIWLQLFREETKKFERKRSRLKADTMKKGAAYMKAYKDEKSALTNKRKEIMDDDFLLHEERHAMLDRVVAKCKRPDKFQVFGIYEEYYGND